MSPWRDLVFLKIGGDARIEIIKSIPKNVQLKTCPIRFPGAQSAPLHPEPPERLLNVNSYSRVGFNLHRGRWKMPLLFSHWKCSW